MVDLRAAGPGGLNLLSAAKASQSIADGAATSVALVTDCLQRIAARDRAIGAWAYVDRDAALEQARQRDRAPRRGPLHGVPVGIKDIFDTHDMPTAYGSQIYAGHRPETDTAVVALLRRAGAVILGKTVTTEFASPVPAGTRNPHDLSRSPGVSSSGSAAAVADFMVPLAVGSQTGGSTILPAGFCGVVGYKASLTGIDRGGLRHLKPTLDTIGLFARTVDDIALLRAALVGSVEREAELAGGSDPPRIGVCRTFNWGQAEPATQLALETATRQLAAHGARIADVVLPSEFDGIESSFRTISAVEGARSLALEVRAHQAKLNAWAREAVGAARATDQATYEKAQLHAVTCQRALTEILLAHDVLITPSTCGEAVANLTAVPNSAFNRTWTLMHVPTLSLPAFAGPNQLPVGIQVVGPVGSDDRTIAWARWIADRIG